MKFNKDSYHKDGKSFASVGLDNGTNLFCITRRRAVFQYDYESYMHSDWVIPDEECEALLDKFRQIANIWTITFDNYNNLYFVCNYTTGRRKYLHKYGYATNSKCSKNLFGTKEEAEKILLEYCVDQFNKQLKKGKTMKCPTEEQVLAAAEKENVKEALSELFPEIIGREIDLSPFYGSAWNFSRNISPVLGDTFQIRDCGPFRDKGFFLSSKFDWKIEEDDGCYVLVPRRKG